MDTTAPAIPEREEAGLAAYDCSDPAEHELRCAQQVVSILFRHAGLTAVLGEGPVVSVGNGNWISFAADGPVPNEIILALRKPDGAPAFSADLIHPSRSIRSRTSPSLHLTSIGAGGNLHGHVDAYHWTSNPWKHAGEFFARKTELPSELLRRLRNLR